MLCQKGILQLLIWFKAARAIFTIGLSGFDENSINEASLSQGVREKGHIQQNIEIDQISDDEIEADGQFETSEKTLNDFLNSHWCPWPGPKISIRFLAVSR